MGVSSGAMSMASRQKACEEAKVSILMLLFKCEIGLIIHVGI